jgi:hypothetical protein
MLTASNINRISSNLARQMFHFETELMICYIKRDKLLADKLIAKYSKLIPAASIKTVIASVKTSYQNDNNKYKKYLAAIEAKEKEQETENIDEKVKLKIDLVSNTLQNELNIIMNSSYSRLDWNNAGFQGIPAEVEKQILAFADNGIYKIDNLSIESWTRREVVSCVNKASSDADMIRAKSVGVDKFIISWHFGARPEHAIWQGRVFTESELYQKCGLGTAAGLQGINCRHSFSPYFDDLDDDDYSFFKPKDKKESDKLYELEQEQRFNERTIRKYKRRVSLLEAQGLDTITQQNKVLAWQARQRNLINLHPELRRDFSREKIF